MRDISQLAESVHHEFDSACRISVGLRCKSILSYILVHHSESQRMKYLRKSFGIVTSHGLAGKVVSGVTLLLIASVTLALSIDEGEMAHTSLQAGGTRPLMAFRRTF